MKKLMYITFLFNFLFSLLTAILPLLVFELTELPATSGYVLTIFMISLLCTRIFLLKYHFNQKPLLSFGLTFYCSGFFLLFINASSLLVFYIGAILLGVGVGIVAPLLLTIITSIGDNPKLMVGMHNSLLGIASATAPFVGLFLFYEIIEKKYLYLVLFILSLSALIPSIYLKIDKVNDIKKKNNILKSKAFKLNYLSNYLSFLLVSISYGAIIAFLPILLEQRNLRIDVFYFFFWSFFILSQLYMSVINKYIPERVLLPICIVLIGITSLFLGIATNYFRLISNAIFFGFFYGGLMNLFYNRLSLVKDIKIRSDAFSIFGLMSYLGVGLGSLLLGPIANNSLTLVFITASVFPFIGLMTHWLISLFINKKMA